MADMFCSFDLRQTRVQKQQATVLGSTKSSGYHVVGYAYDSQFVSGAGKQEGKENHQVGHDAQAFGMSSLSSRDHDNQMQQCEPSKHIAQCVPADLPNQGKTSSPSS